MRCLVLLALVVASYGFAILPEDLPKLNERGQCPSGLPRDGLFNACDFADWRTGFLWHSSNEFSFDSNFASLPSFLDFGSALPDNSRSCSLRVPGNGVAYQLLPNIMYAHYRIVACAKVHGDSPCRVQVRSSHNEIMDELEFRPSLNVTCPFASECVPWSNFSGILNLTVRYEGVVPAPIYVIDTSLLLSDFSNFKDGVRYDVHPNQEFVVSHLDFATDFLPARLAFFTGESGERVDIITLTNTHFNALPGQHFGDEHQFLSVRALTPEGQICSSSEQSDPQTCSCLDDNVDEVCLMSRGFVADPENEYYLGMMSQSCDCSFDSVCLHQVDNEEGYFGLPWILVNRTSSA